MAEKTISKKLSTSNEIVSTDYQNEKGGNDMCLQS